MKNWGGKIAEIARKKGRIGSSTGSLQVRQVRQAQLPVDKLNYLCTSSLTYGQAHLPGDKLTYLGTSSLIWGMS